MRRRPRERKTRLRKRKAFQRGWLSSRKSGTSTPRGIYSAHGIYGMERRSLTLPPSLVCNRDLHEAERLAWRCQQPAACYTRISLSCCVPRGQSHSREPLHSSIHQSVGDLPTYQTLSWTGSRHSIPVTESANRPSFSPSSPHIQHHPGLWWHGLSI